MEGSSHSTVILIHSGSIRNHSAEALIKVFNFMGKAEDAMMHAPAEVDEVQLRELHIKVRESNK